MKYNQQTVDTLLNHQQKIEDHIKLLRSNLILFFTKSISQPNAPKYFPPVLQFSQSNEEPINYFVIRIEKNLRIQYDIITDAFSFQYEKDMDFNEFKAFSKRIAKSKFEFDIDGLSKKFFELNKTIAMLQQAKWMHFNVCNIVESIGSVSSEKFEELIMYSDVEKIHNSSLIGAREGKTAVVVWYRKFLKTSFPQMAKKHGLFKGKIELPVVKKKRRTAVKNA